MTKKQIHVYYSGRVQGIGFRFTVERVANDLGGVGWVRNLRDGKVEVVAEGEEGALKDFLDKVSRHFSRYIQDTDVEWQEAAGEFKDFEIRF
jgi:acylphosphatase